MNEEKTKFSLPFGVDFAIEQDLSELEGYKLIKKRSTIGSYDIDCPFCGGESKLNVNFVKGMWRCNKCNSSGNAITLHARLKGLSNKDAYHDLLDRFHGLGSEAQTKYQYVQHESDAPKPADLYLRDVAYSTLLKDLTLTDKHRSDLHKRGLSDEFIEKFEYKTYPVLRKTFAMNATMNGKVSEVAKESGTQIPGFYDYGKDTMLVKRKPGFLVPVRTLDGRISMFQIRNDTPKDPAAKGKFSKYVTLSSGEKMTGTPCSVPENIHHVGFELINEEGSDAVTCKVPNAVYITEGALKADVCHALSGKAFIAILGVNNQKQLDEEFRILKELGAKTIVSCFDMDYVDNPHVAAAMEELRNKIENAGLHYERLVWDRNYKGLDDFLLARKIKHQSF